MQKRLGRIWIACAMAALSLMGCAAAGARPREALDSQTASLESAAAPAPAIDEAKMAYGEGNDAIQSASLSGAALDRKIIYTVSLDLVVEDTEVAFQEVERLAEEIGGYVARSNMWQEDNHPRGSLTVRVPAERLDEALTKFKALAVDVEAERRDSQDVTEEYVDLTARLDNEKRTERELQELLETRSKSGKTADILEVHRELSSVRSQIEQIQGRMTYLDNLSAMATVEISLTPDVLTQPVVVAGWRPKGTALQAIKMLVNALQGIADAAIMFFLLILPVLIVIAIPIVALILLLRFVVRRVRQRRKRAKAASAQPADGSAPAE
jgi:vacuolar-type H+-ATPase subunit I/STV1